MEWCRRMALLAAFALFAGCASTGVEMSDQWRIHVNGKADSNGKVELEFVGLGKVIAEVAVDVVAGTRENDVARRIRDELQLKLPPGMYTVRLDDGEEVVVRRARDAEDFQIRLAGNSVTGTRVTVERD